MQREAHMNIEHKSKTLEIPPRILAYLNEKVSRFDKFFRKEPTLGANLNLLRGKYTCELTLEVSGRIIKASGQTSNRLPNSRVFSSLNCRWKKLRNLLRAS